jgi:hypothetical protein
MGAKLRFQTGTEGERPSCLAAQECTLLVILLMTEGGIRLRRLGLGSWVWRLFIFCCCFAGCQYVICERVREGRASTSLVNSMRSVMV